MDTFVNKIMIEFKNIDKLLIKIVIKGLHICLYSLVFPIMLLITYNIYPLPNLYYIGISLSKSIFFFMVSIISCGYTFNIIKKDLK